MERRALVTANWMAVTGALFGFSYRFEKIINRRRGTIKVKDNLMADAVFEGGGVKGIGLTGAVAVAEERGYQWVNVAGTSAGAIVAALLAAGYSAAEVNYPPASWGAS